MICILFNYIIMYRSYIFYSLELFNILIEIDYENWSTDKILKYLILLIKNNLIDENERKLFIKTYKYALA